MDNTYYEFTIQIYRRDDGLVKLVKNKIRDLLDCTVPNKEFEISVINKLTREVLI